MAGHTPGPWVAEKGHTNRDEMEHGAWGSVSTDAFYLATIWADVDAIEGSGEANARLIAAAPDLYAVLKAAVERSDRIHGEGLRRLTEMQDLYDAAVAALTKAEGRQP